MYETFCSLKFSEQDSPFNDNSINVIAFEGEEAVSSLYHFNITVAVAVDHKNSHWQQTKKMFNQPAKLVLTYRHSKTDNSENLQWHGIITGLVQDGRDDEYCYYKLKLEPEIAKLRWLFCSDVYLDKQIDDIIKDVMQQGDFKKFKVASKEQLDPQNDDYDYLINIDNTDKGETFSKLLKNSHQNFTCQFEESSLDFLQRRLEFYGIYYSFVQLQDKACIVFSHNLQIPKEYSPEFLTAEYNPTYNSETTNDAIAITHLSKALSLQADTLYLQRSSSYFNTTEETLTPASHALFDYNSTTGLYSTNDQFERLKEQQEGSSKPLENRDINGEDLAKFRAQAIQAKQAQVTGIAVSPGISSGQFLHIEEQLTAVDLAATANDEQRKDDYFVLSVKHHWGASDKTQWQYEKASLQAYQADFVLHPCFIDGDESSPLAYYPQQSTPIPRIERMVGGFIDGQPYKTQDNPNAPDIIDTSYPAIDEYGRYRVRFAFARQLKASYEKNSAWVRLATPFAGGTPNRTFNQQGQAINTDNRYQQGAGMHFPLRAGTEVLIAFVNGDPDYPVIVSALPNQKEPSPVSKANKQQFVLKTPVGNKMTIRDAVPSQGSDKPSSNSYWQWNTPAMNTQFNLGQYVYKGVDKKLYASSGFMLSTQGMGVIQSDEMLYLKSKQGVKIMSGDKSPEKMFAPFVDKVTQMNLASAPESGTDHTEQHKGGKEDQTKKDENFYEEYEKARKKRNEENFEYGNSHHIAEGSTKEVGIEGSGKLAGIDVALFAGGAKADATAAAALAEVQFCGYKFTLEGNKWGHAIEYANQKVLHSNVEKKTNTELTKKLDIQKEELIKEYKSIIRSGEEKIEELNQKIGQGITEYGTFLAKFNQLYKISAEGGLTAISALNELLDLTSAELLLNGTKSVNAKCEKSSLSITSIETMMQCGTSQIQLTAASTSIEGQVLKLQGEVLSTEGGFVKLG